jgi:hypothetical protein
LLGGYLAVSTLSTDTSALGYILRFIPIGLGIGVFQSPNNSAVMGTAPRERLGVVSGMLAISRTLGQTTGIAVLGAVWASLTLLYAGGAVLGGATEAPPEVQVAALQTTMRLVSGIVLVALALSLWALRVAREE